MNAAVSQLPREPVPAAEPRQACGQFTVTLNLTQQRGISMVGNVYSDDTPAAINARIDVYQSALDRQFVRADIVSKRAQIAGHTQNLRNLREAYEALVMKQKGAKKLTSQEQQHLANYEPTVKAASEAIDSLRAAIAEAERQLAA